jgi:hypothetical protein
MGADERLRAAVCDACEELLEDPIGADIDAIAAKYQLCIDERFRGPGARSLMQDGRACVMQDGRASPSELALRPFSK